MAPQIISGNKNISDCTVGIAVANWNSFITDELLEGALNIFTQKGFSDTDIIVARCPGAYEIPFTARKLLEKTDGVVTLGAVIRGDTPHFHYVCDAVTRGITDLNLNTGKPISFGVLTTDNVEQAMERASAEKGNKGAEAALALWDMLLFKQNVESL